MSASASYRNEWLLALLGLGLVAAVGGYQRYLAHEQTRSAEEARLLGLARTVADNMERQLHSVSGALANVSIEFPPSGSPKVSRAEASRRLQRFCDMTGVRTLSVLDPQGTLVASNREQQVGRNFRERGYFSMLPERPDADVLYVSAPYTTALGVYSINITRAILRPGGELAGAVTATLDPEYFDVVARSVLYADDMNVSFVHGDGTLFYSRPDLPTAVGKNLNRPGAIFTQHMASGQGSTVVSAQLLVTGSRRMIANHNLQPAALRMDQPLVIGVARDLSGIYAGWVRQTELYALSFLLLAAASCGALAWSQRRRAALAAEAAAHQRERDEQVKRQTTELAERLQVTQSDLHSVEAHLALAADAARLGIWTQDVATGEVWVSDPWRALFGFQPTERVTVALFLQRIHPDDLDLVEGEYADAQRHGRYEVEFRVVLPDGRVRWIASRGRLESDSKGRPAMVRAVSLDITERKRADLELQQQRREVTRLARVILLGELSGALAHELNQPLAAILSNAQAAQRFMQRDPIDLDEVRAILADIVSEDRRAGEVIHRLRRLLSTGEAQRLPVDVNELMAETLKLLSSDLLIQRITLVTELTPALPSAWGDRVQLQQVVINLVVNACDAMRDLPAAERRLTVRTRCLPDGGVQVSVIDQGCGLPEGNDDKVFESFYSTKPSGMGLGLSICRTIIHAHGGRLWGENNAGRGASFHFIVPGEVARAA